MTSMVLMSAGNFGGDLRLRLFLISSRCCTGVGAESTHPHKPPDGGAKMQYSGGMMLSFCCVL